ncbi:MAG: 4-(cytidine 5'-diphospho)-2-C-methyl-D-erythritol kinase [Candidatus Bipolaricaulota bacterium]|nr:4-(cytidine 5'-diphospho)-2-C-methyl-D-erythritol kinase [Candidatus Bipolaricaulota bacterium]
MSKTVKAFAKINLGLRVRGQRPDGYHEIETLFQSVDLHDVLTLVPQKKECEILVTVSSLWPVPQGRENLVYRAAELIFSHTGLKAGVRIHLEKRIPVGAGLGGGSSDAAATLVGLNELFQFQLSDAELRQLALELGSDVPYFLIGGLCRGRGRGEILERLPSYLEEYSFVLIKPASALSTEAVYREYDLLRVRGWQPPAARLCEGIDCANDLEDAALRLCPQLRELRHILSELQPDLWGMSGSGPTYYAAWRAPAYAQRAAQALARRGYDIYRTQPTNNSYEFAEESTAL